MENATPIDWSVTEAAIAVKMVIPWDQLIQFEDGRAPDPQVIEHTESHPIPEWIIATRDSAAYRKFWRDMAFSVSERAQSAAEGVIDALLEELGMTREETGAGFRVSVGDHPALELDDQDELPGA